MLDNLVIKRTKRYPINTLMVYSDVKGPHKFEHATLYNFNNEGLYFETNDPLTPGSEIVIQINNYMPGPYSPEGSDTYHAKVKWCTQTEDLEGYAVGAEITEEIIESKTIAGNPCHFPFDGLLEH